MKDDISLQAPGKGDTIIVRINGQKKNMAQKSYGKKSYDPSASFSNECNHCVIIA